MYTRASTNSNSIPFRWNNGHSNNNIQSVINGIDNNNRSNDKNLQIIVGNGSINNNCYPKIRRIVKDPMIRPIFKPELLAMPKQKQKRNHNKHHRRKKKKLKATPSPNLTYKQLLDIKLTTSKRRIIYLTKQAKVDLNHDISLAKSDFNAIMQHFSQLKKSETLPLIYLIDSICQDIGDIFIKLFAKYILNIMKESYKSIKDKNKICKVLQVWNEKKIFDAKLLRQISDALLQVDVSRVVSNHSNMFENSNNNLIHLNNLYADEIKYIINNSKPRGTIAKPMQLNIQKQQQTLDNHHRNYNDFPLLATDAHSFVPGSNNNDDDNMLLNLEPARKKRRLILDDNINGYDNSNNNNSNNNNNNAYEEDNDLEIITSAPSLNCPLTTCRFKEPMKSIFCQHVFEKSAIIGYIESSLKDYIKNKNKDEDCNIECPLPGCTYQIAKEFLFDDLEMKQLINNANNAQIDNEKKQHFDVLEISDDDDDDQDDNTMNDLSQIGPIKEEEMCTCENSDSDIEILP